MNFDRRVLFAGGLFNCVMGLFFISNKLLAVFMRFAMMLEENIFSRNMSLFLPQNPVHLLLIHGFGAAALILGTTLIYSSKDPAANLPFIWFDGLGRLLFGSMMTFYVFRYSLMWTILVFAIIELLFAIAYLWVAYRLSDGQPAKESS